MEKAQKFERIEKHLYRCQYQTSTGDWSSRYYAIFTDWKRKRRTFPLGGDLQGARDKLGVLHKRNDAEFDFDKEKAERARENGRTFAEWADECIKLQRDGVKVAKRAIRGSTLEREVDCVEALRRFFGEMKLVDITAAKIADYEPWRTAERIIRHGQPSKKYVSQSTVGNELACLKKFLRYAAKRGEIPAAPVVDVPRKGERSRVLKESEQAKLLKAAPAWLRRILIVAPETCLSKGDLLRLTDDMIDLDEGVIVPEGGRVKTDVEQISPITPAVRAVLEEIRAERSKVASISKLVFTKHGRPITKNMLRRGLATAMKKAGIKDFTFHDYRHTAKTKWAGEGIPVEAAMKAAGHKSVAMHNRYVHLQRSDVARAFRSVLKWCTNENEAEKGSAVSG